MVELPSLTKSMALNINVLMAVLIFTMAAILTLWQFVPYIVTPIIELPGQEIGFEYSYLPEAARGDPWPVNITVINTGDKAVENVMVEVKTDDVIAGTKVVVGTVMAKTSKVYTIGAAVKAKAELGPHTAAITAFVPGAEATIQEVDIEVMAY